MAKNRKNHLIGLGLDNKDEHKRITKGEGFSIVGGSKETHEKMQDQTIYMSEILKKKGKTIENASIEQVREAIERAEEKVGD